MLLLDVMFVRLMQVVACGNSLFDEIHGSAFYVTNHLSILLSRLLVCSVLMNCDFMIILVKSCVYILLGNVTHWVPQVAALREICLQEAHSFLPSTPKLSLRSVPKREQGRGIGNHERSWDCTVVTAKVSAKVWGALELKWSHRVVPNSGKEARP